MRINIAALKGRKHQVVQFLPEGSSGACCVPVSTGERDAAVAALEAEQRWLFAAKACLGTYGKDYAEEWSAIHHLPHVRDGETDLHCKWCRLETEASAGPAGRSST